MHTKHLIRLALVGIMVFTGTVLAATSAVAQTVDDWKNAASQASSGRGCASIPYSNYRQDCDSAQRRVDEFVNSKWTCDGLDVRPLQEKVDNLTRAVEDMKRDRESQARNPDSQSKVAELDKKIESATKELDFTKQSISTDRSDIDIRIEKIRSHVRDRKEVQSVFEKASSSASNESDPEKKTYVEGLRAYWERGRQEHMQPIQDAERAESKCHDFKR